MGTAIELNFNLSMTSMKLVLFKIGISWDLVKRVVMFYVYYEMSYDYGNFQESALKALP